MGLDSWETSHSSICIAKDPKMSAWTIRNNIRKLRFHHDEMTQQQLAELVRVTRQTIVAIEKGKYTPSLDLAFRIARAFDAPLEEVFFLEETTG
jgi:putative transcriptional regulator